MCRSTSPAFKPSARLSLSALLGQKSSSTHTLNIGGIVRALRALERVSVSRLLCSVLVLRASYGPWLVMPCQHTAKSRYSGAEFHTWAMLHQIGHQPLHKLYVPLHKMLHKALRRLKSHNRRQPAAVHAILLRRCTSMEKP
ncbi:hypothetical protein LI328DRAFT_46049 [Trichoderma asperelloides]|nr:hypothetical protein LI328DRAFT_46049 [Trichoderma asperelloides]